MRVQRFTAEPYRTISPPWMYLSEVMGLYDAGFNVFPLPFGQKSGYPWKRLQYTRLPRERTSQSVLSLFSTPNNVGIVCGRSSQNLFVLDCETEVSFHRNIAAMRFRNMPIWAVQTARGGHLYFRSTVGEVDNISVNIMHDMEVRGKHGYILAPPSLHPTGVFYQWYLREGNAPPVIHPSEIDWLTDRYGNPLTLSYTPDNNYNYRKSWMGYQHKPASNLSNHTKDYLRSGHTLSEGIRNDSLFRAACDLCGNDYSYSDATNLLYPVASSSGLSEREIAKTIASAYSVPREPSRPNNYQPEPEIWRYAMYFMIRHQWTGRCRSSDRAVFMALVERARVAINDDGLFRASIREIAELARMGTSTVMRALKRLQDMEMPLIERVIHDRMSGASVWAFTDTVLTMGKQYEATVKFSEIPTELAAYATSLFNAEACERGSVGRSAMELYRYMTTNPVPMMPKEITEKSHLTINQVNYALRRLKEFGLVTRESEGWKAIDMSDDDLDKFVKAPLRSEKRKIRFQNERQNYAGSLLLRKQRQREKAQVALFIQMQNNLENNNEVEVLCSQEYLGWYFKRLNPAFTDEQCLYMQDATLMMLFPPQSTDDTPIDVFKAAKFTISVRPDTINCHTTHKIVYKKRLKRRDKPG